MEGTKNTREVEHSARIQGGGDRGNKGSKNAGV